MNYQIGSRLLSYPIAAFLFVRKQMMTLCSLKTSVLLIVTLIMISSCKKHENAEVIGRQIDNKVEKAGEKIDVTLEQFSIKVEEAREAIKNEIESDHD
ncbi:hypothetical protein [Methylophilus sp. 3sh_L]|uniref:hypothetical protein n=1 Tax=Methylophilus sp. 3sh_L TaxID=3377114 RepID=UPI00398F6360